MVVIFYIFLIPIKIKKNLIQQIFFNTFVVQKKKLIGELHCYMVTSFHTAAMLSLFQNPLFLKIIF